jgi:hypothetical protein
MHHRTPNDWTPETGQMTRWLLSLERDEHTDCDIQVSDWENHRFIHWVHLCGLMTDVYEVVL